MLSVQLATSLEITIGVLEKISLSFVLVFFLLIINDMMTIDSNKIALFFFFGVFLPLLFFVSHPFGTNTWSDTTKTKNCCVNPPEKKNSQFSFFLRFGAKLKHRPLFFFVQVPPFFFLFLPSPLTWNDWLNNPSLYVNKFSRMKFPLFIVPHHGQPKNDCNHRSRSSLSLSLCLTRENKQIFSKFF